MYCEIINDNYESLILCDFLTKTKNYAKRQKAIKIDNIYTLKSITADNFTNSNTYNKDNPGICKSKTSLIIGNNYFRIL